MGLIGFIAGVGAGVYFLRGGFQPGEGRIQPFNAGGYIIPLLVALLLFLLLKGTVFNPDAGGPIFFSKEGPGSMAAPIAISLLAGLVVGFLAQRTRLCLSGGIRDFILIRENYLLLGFIGIFVGALVLNSLLGFSNPDL